MLAVIPFQGFYSSVHDDAIDAEVEQMLEEGSDELCKKFWDEGCIRYSMIYGKYAKDYVEAYAEHAKLPMIFDELKRPREYNFGSDRVFVRIPLAELERLFLACDREKLEKVIHDTFTSRSGFISYYPNSLKSWDKNIAHWDHNQIGALLVAAVEPFDEDSYAQELRSDGTMGNWAWEALTPLGQRLAKIATYQGERRNRA